MGDVSTNFSLSEFFSANDRGETWKTRRPKAALLMTLEVIRASVGKPVRIESGIRSVEHNARLPNSVPDSGHLTGEAADIWVDGMTSKQLGGVIRTLYSQERLPYLTYSYLVGGTSVHVGVDKKSRKSIWGPGY